MNYHVEKFEINEQGLHFNREVKVANLESEQRALSWLSSARQAVINTEANGRFVTPIRDWVFNVLASSAEGDKVVICYHVVSMNEPVRIFKCPCEGNNYKLAGEPNDSPTLKEREEYWGYIKAGCSLLVIPIEQFRGENWKWCPKHCQSLL